MVDHARVRVGVRVRVRVSVMVRVMVRVRVWVRVRVRVVVRTGHHRPRSILVDHIVDHDPLIFDA